MRNIVLGIDKTNTPRVISIDQSGVAYTQQVTAVPAIYNVQLTVANTEYSIELPVGCRRFDFQCRSNNDVRFAFETGRVGASVAPYVTLKSGFSYSSGDISPGDSPLTLYFAASSGGLVIEIVAWT